MDYLLNYFRSGFILCTKRHRQSGKALRAAIKAMNLVLFAEEGYYSNTVTAIKVPDNLTAQQIIDEMKKNGVIITGGQGHLKGKIFRIAHMNIIGKNEILQTITKLEQSLKNLGHQLESGKGLEAAKKVYSGN